MLPAARPPDNGMGIKHHSSKVSVTPGTLTCCSLYLAAKGSLSGAENKVITVLLSPEDKNRFGNRTNSQTD